MDQLASFKCITTGQAYKTPPSEESRYVVFKRFYYLISVYHFGNKMCFIGDKRDNLISSLHPLSTKRHVASELSSYKAPKLHIIAQAPINQDIWWINST